MAGPRGYHNYRGRTPKGKIVLAVVLVLVILASIAVMIFQRNLVYGRDGTPYLDLPWGQEEQQPETPDEELDLTIQEPERAETLYAFSGPGEALTEENWEAARQITAMSAPAFNGFCITLKDDSGAVFFDTASAVPGAKATTGETAAILERITGEDSPAYTIARLSCFHDPKAANADVENLGLKNTGGYLFYDGNNSQWLDPAKPAARAYLCQLAREAAELGFDEILLTDVSYPTVGKLDKVDDGGVDRAETLVSFLEELRAALDPYGVALSIELPEAVLTDGADETAGLDLAGIAPLVNRVYAETTPENIESLRTAVTAANAGTDFVAELTAYGPDVTGSCLILN